MREGRLGFRLREVREQSDLTQQDLARMLGVSARTILRYENDQSAMTAPVLVQLAEIFGVSTDYLVGRTDRPSYEPLAPEEARLLANFRNAPTGEAREAILSVSESLASR